MAISFLRLFARQLPGDERGGFEGEEHDLMLLLTAGLGLIFTIPRFINPRSQDVLYVIVMLSIDSSYLVKPVDVDVRELITFLSTGRFMYGVLAKRIGCVVFCVLVHFLQAVYISRQQEDSDSSKLSPWLFGLFLMQFIGIIAVRILMRENVLLRVNLEKRTVEMGAVSSLLTACYDAVVEVDHTLKLTQDSRHLSSMLLRTQVDLAGKSLLDFFCKEDKSRISEQFLGSISKSAPANRVTALNADMLDSDFNHVKVELFAAQFRNLANERCFLVAFREIQDVAPQVLPAHVSSSQELVVQFDLYTFDVSIMTGKMQQLCKSHLGDGIPDNVLDIASHDSRHSLCQQLQNLGNAFAETYASNDFVATVTFDFLGLSPGCKASVTIEHDDLLDCWMAKMILHLNVWPSAVPNIPSPTLTQSNLHSLDRSNVVRVRSSGSSSRHSSRGSSRGSNGSGSRRSSRNWSRAQMGGSEAGFLSQLHTKVQL